MIRTAACLVLASLAIACSAVQTYEGPERDEAQLAFVIPENQQNRQRAAGRAELLDAGAGQSRFVQALHCGKPGGATPLTRRHAPFRAAPRCHEPGDPSDAFSAIISRQARAAKPPLSRRSVRARSIACSRFSQVKIPFDTGRAWSIARV